MNTRHAQYMLTILQEGSITGAAKKLYISQPSLSQMVKSVEANLGVLVFNRNTDPITLTYAGQKYMEAARQVLSINENLKKEIEEIAQEEHGKLRLGIPIQRGMLALPQVLPKFFAQYPHVDVELVEFGSTETEKSLLEGKIDIACITTIPRHDKIRYLLIENEEIVLLASKNTDIARRVPDGTPISILEAKQENFVSNKTGHSIRFIQDNIFAANNISPKILLETVSIEIEKKVAASCGAVMICPLNYIEKDEGFRSQIHIYPLKGVSGTRHCYLCHRKDLYLTKYMRGLIDIFSEMAPPSIPKP